MKSHLRLCADHNCKQSNSSGCFSGLWCSEYFPKSVVLYGWHMISPKRFSKDFNCGPWTLGCWSSIWWLADVCFFLLFWGGFFPLHARYFCHAAFPKLFFRTVGFLLWKAGCELAHTGDCPAGTPPTQATKFTSQNLHTLWFDLLCSLFHFPIVCSNFSFILCQALYYFLFQSIIVLLCFYLRTNQATCGV